MCLPIMITRAFNHRAVIFHYEYCRARIKPGLLAPAVFSVNSRKTHGLNAPIPSIAGDHRKRLIPPSPPFPSGGYGFDR